MRSDPIVAEVRRARDEHAARFGFDLHQIVADLKEQERLSGATFVSLPPKPPRAAGRATAMSGAFVRETGDERLYEAWEAAVVMWRARFDGDGRTLCLEMTNEDQRHLRDYIADGSADGLDGWGITYYAFRCLHCGKLRGYSDID